MKINKKKFGELVKEWRKNKAKINQKELAHDLEISQGSLCEIELGINTPSASTITAFYNWTTFDVMKALTNAVE